MMPFWNSFAYLIHWYVDWRQFVVLLIFHLSWSFQACNILQLTGQIKSTSLIALWRNSFQTFESFQEQIPQGHTLWISPSFCGEAWPLRFSGDMQQKLRHTLRYVGSACGGTSKADLTRRGGPSRLYICEPLFFWPIRTEKGRRMHKYTVQLHGTLCNAAV